MADALSYLPEDARKQASAAMAEFLTEEEQKFALEKLGEWIGIDGQKVPNWRSIKFDPLLRKPVIISWLHGFSSGYCAALEVSCDAEGRAAL